jgi:lipopolysaccharide/colanic/teichoic acid biosynthesis glycosyltransferase
MFVEGICATSVGLVVYHHVLYPLALKRLTAGDHGADAPPAMRDDLAPAMTLIIPAYNEARFIRAKILNSAALSYPDAKLSIIVVCDGCTDDTAELARATVLELGSGGARVRVVAHAANRGKIAILNETIADVPLGLVALSDASALLASDALLQGARHFADITVGFVSGKYRIGDVDARQKSYWRYQNAIKTAEARLGSPIGAHGAFYVFRRDLWAPLEVDTINDDVMLPMRIVEAGYRGVYDQAIEIVEVERDDLGSDLSRRRRLAAGAVQQALRLWRLADPTRPGLAFSFLSGKALRAFMPFVMLAAFISNFALIGGSSVWTVLMAAQLVGYGLATIGLVSENATRLPGVSQLSYLVGGHVAGLFGATRYLLGLDKAPWRRARGGKNPADVFFMRRGAMIGKRALDVTLASIALAGLCFLFPFIAAAIKLESKGPIFYRQLRVGLRTPKFSRLFYLTKFRTMRVDAEVSSGAVWATEDDPRITRVGRFMRKTRLDELPQCVDVLRGDMSIVGPRPERPHFFQKLEAAIPFYAERTYGLKPGITGLAQVTLPYDSSIEDVRAKVLHDHAYALQLSAPGRWLVTDLSIILRTFTVMVLGKGR